MPDTNPVSEVVWPGKPVWKWGLVGTQFPNHNFHVFEEQVPKRGSFANDSAMKEHVEAYTHTYADTCACTVIHIQIHTYVHIPEYGHTFTYVWPWRERMDVGLYVIVMIMCLLQNFRIQNSSEWLFVNISRIADPQNGCFPATAFSVPRVLRSSHLQAPCFMISIWYWASKIAHPTNMRKWCDHN